MRDFRSSKSTRDQDEIVFFCFSSAPKGRIFSEPISLNVNCLQDLPRIMERACLCSLCSDRNMGVLLANFNRPCVCVYIHIWEDNKKVQSTSSQYTYLPSSQPISARGHLPTRYTYNSQYILTYTDVKNSQ